MARSAGKSDVNVLLSLKEGSESAFSEIYNAYSRGVYRKLLYMVKSKDDAEELTQETFVRLWEKRSLIDPDQPIIPYILRIAGNLVHDLYRRSARDQQLQQAIIAASSELYLHTEEDLLYKESKALIDSAIEALPDQQRQVFKLVKLEGKSYQEVSEQLGIGTATVSTHIVRATKSVRQFLFNSYGGPALLLAAFLLWC
ncbi:RNA polymerase sigma-70 factor, ECF subfamily [bacterium A37T11]|nr:RNA polymerase sigma-70 factor, ECF subfamily [bacterium A37T11]